MAFLSYLFRQIFVHPRHLPKDLDLSGQTVLITGANSGIGREAAHECVRLHARFVILGVRDVHKGEEAKKEILQRYPESQATIGVWKIDLNDPSSILEVKRKAQDLQRLDVAILNAGVFPFQYTTCHATGHEMTLQVNHLSTAMLSLVIIPILRQSACKHGKPSRLTFTSSEVHMWTPFKERKEASIFDAMDKAEAFDRWNSYFNSKLLNVFWVLELSARVPSSEVVINLLNPGSVNSGLHRDFDKATQIFDKVVGRTVEEGARLLLDAAFVQDASTHGKYLSENRVKQVGAIARGDEGRQLRSRLWAETREEMQRYGIDPTC